MSSEATRKSRADAKLGPDTRNLGHASSKAGKLAYFSESHMILLMTLLTFSLMTVLTYQPIASSSPPGARNSRKPPLDTGAQHSSTSCAEFLDMLTYRNSRERVTYGSIPRRNGGNESSSAARSDTTALFCPQF